MMVKRHVNFLSFEDAVDHALREGSKLLVLIIFLRWFSWISPRNHLFARDSRLRLVEEICCLLSDEVLYFVLSHCLR